MLFTVTYSIFYSLLYVSFEPEVTKEIETLNTVATCIFILDLLFNFLLEYEDQETFLYVRDHKKIA